MVVWVWDLVKLPNTTKNTTAKEGCRWEMSSTCRMIALPSPGCTDTIHRSNQNRQRCLRGFRETKHGAEYRLLRRWQGRSWMPQTSPCDDPEMAGDAEKCFPSLSLCVTAAIGANLGRWYKVWKPSKRRTKASDVDGARCSETFMILEF